MHKNKEDKREYDKQYRFNNKEKIKIEKKQYQRFHSEDIRKKAKKNYLLRKYGLSYNDWLIMWESQEGKCAICGESFKNPASTCVDHDHNTDEIRGLLCTQCNAGIGLLHDSPEMLIKAAEYLRGKR